MNGSQVVERTPIPMLRCPSDRYSPWQAHPLISCYDDVGTSYQYNLHALMGTNIDPWGPPGNQGENWRLINRVLLRECLAKYASLYLVYLEDSMNWALESQVKEVGTHGELGKHIGAYLDGHADYAYRDTRRWCGVGWAAIVPSWRFAGFNSPPIYYMSYINPPKGKNCDP